MFQFAHERWKRAPDTSGEWEGSRGAGHGSLCVALKRNNYRKMSCVSSLGAQVFMTTYLLFVMGCVAQKVSWRLFTARIIHKLYLQPCWVSRSHKSCYSTIVCFSANIVTPRDLKQVTWRKSRCHRSLRHIWNTQTNTCVNYISNLNLVRLFCTQFWSTKIQYTVVGGSKKRYVVWADL